MNSLGTLGSSISGSIASNSALKEIIDIGSFATDRFGRFKDIVFDNTQNHKIRRILNHFLVPKIKPSFVDDDESSPHHDDRVPDDWLAKAEEDLKTPARMIDVDTMNMVPTYNLGMHDQYCIVSHSWKGSELTYGYFGEAKSFEPKMDMTSLESQPASNDVNNIVRKCKSDIERLEAKITSALPHVYARSDGQRPQDITTLLEWYTDANGAEFSLGSSQKNFYDAKATVASAEREAEFYNDLLGNVNGLAEEKSSPDKSKAPANGPEMKKVELAIQLLEREAQENSLKAEEKYLKAVERRGEVESTIIFFEKNRDLCYGIEALLVALQHIRSSRKILESIAQTKRLFDAYFPRGGKRYVWLDTCCINKADSFELSESLSLMGDWYANADLCLVHLDTPRDEKSWIEEWKHWKNPSHVPVPLNMVSFDKIGAGVDEVDKAKNQVEWATRGWTLQELVLSKVTYYVNSHWQNLPRPIETLGPLYFLRAFLPSYLGHPYVRKHRSVPLQRIDELVELLSLDFVNPDMCQEQQLTVMLQALGFVAPRGLKETLAESQIGRAVLTASRQLPRVLSDIISKKSIPDPYFLSDLRDDGHITEKVTLFNHLLSALADLTNDQVLTDRQFIAEFSNVKNMTNWIGGTLGDSSASTSLVAASQRVTTVSTDQAYSLMGILGVRFPAFPAEGLSKALARLLDEVVIAYNDVSVFNWTGKHRGSPLNGRSLYPTNIDSFVDPTNNPLTKSKAKTSKHILDLFRAQRVRQSETARDVNVLLAEMLALSKRLPDQCPVFFKLGELAAQIKQTNFKKLGSQMTGLSGIVAELEGLPGVDRDEETKKKSVGDRLNNTKKRVDAFSESLKFEAPKIEVPKFEVPKLSFGRKKANAQPTADLQPTVAASSAPSTPITDKEETKEETTPSAEEKYKILNEHIQDLIKALENPENPKPEPDRDVALDTQTGTTDSTPMKQEGKRMVCPNPINVSSGGIRGIFDIQRIIVTMIDPGDLRSRVRSAVRGQKIDGWCTISTGLAITLVAFSVERDILEQQLDLAEVITSYIEPEKSKVTPEGEDVPKEDEDATEKEKGILAGFKIEKTPEQLKVARMINFVQKPSLEGIAGEWVLARFSGVAGANWFLCQLALGAGNDFYGRRIATDAFSFEDAAPEQGLSEYWHNFTMEKKARTCDTLDMYLNRHRMWHAAGDPKTEAPQTDGKERFQDDLDVPWDIAQNVTIDNLVKLGKMSGLRIGGLGADLWAKHWEGRIERGALKRVPVSLRTPVRDLDQNRKLLPAMFHAGREMYMF
ncbi:unnamed protein product [Penicillium salamii]|uniref:Heterokaryon incompatibility domain-containing protein n=1 Tax=Penicillium salamii TaxID=1612424 RepID=A0A9W4K094_9EURO|nr:unnamed protein product [Penicillium salamii]